MEVATDLMARGFHVYRNQSPVGPVDMVAISSGGKVLRIQATSGDLGKTGKARLYNAHEEVPYWNVLAVGYPDKVRYYTRQGEEITLGRAPAVVDFRPDVSLPELAPVRAPATDVPLPQMNHPPRQSPPPTIDWTDRNVDFYRWRKAVREVNARLDPRTPPRVKREALLAARRQLESDMITEALSEGMASHWWKLAKVKGRPENGEGPREMEQSPDQVGSLCQGAQ
jgi:hypothetical protein